MKRSETLAKPSRLRSLLFL